MRHNITENFILIFFRTIMVMMVSRVSGHKFNWIRDRLADKSELVRFDPWSEF